VSERACPSALALASGAQGRCAWAGVLTATRGCDGAEAAQRSSSGPAIGPIACAIRTVKGEGVGGLFKGFHPALVSSMTENVVVWTVNSFLRAKLEDHVEEDDFEIEKHQHAMLGALTGAVSAVCICPAEVVKVRQQTRTTRSSVVGVAREIVGQSGPGGLFHGLGPLLLRDIPFYFLFFGAMEAYLEHVPASSTPSLLHSAVSGGLAGSFAWAVVFPLDVLKTRQQVYAGSQSVLGTLRSILADDGIKGLYRGWAPAVLRGFPANGALVFGVHTSRLCIERLEGTGPS